MKTTASCPICKAEITEKEGTATCPSCGLKVHENCAQAFNYKCPVCSVQLIPQPRQTKITVSGTNADDVERVVKSLLNPKSIDQNVIQNLTIRTNTSHRVTPILKIDKTVTTNELLSAYAEKINLPSNTNGAIIRRTSGKLLQPDETLESAGIQDGEMLIVTFSLHKAVIKILFLAANPKNMSRLRLDEELRSIDQALNYSEFRERFDIKSHWAVRVSDIQSHLLRHKPTIVHFSGHGSDASEIILEDSFGNSYPVNVDSLGKLFSLFKGNIRCVVLNACYSEKQAQIIAEHIDCVVGMPNAIEDNAAISFATSFYQALGYGKDVKTAFELGCLQIDMEKYSRDNSPKLLASRINPESLVFIQDGKNA